MKRLLITIDGPAGTGKTTVSKILAERLGYIYVDTGAFYRGVAFEAKIVIDASGHDSVAVKRLVDRGLVDWKGMNPMFVNEGEEHVVEKTGEVYPGLIAAGMSVTETHGLARMGPTFGSMLFSGKKAAEIAAEKIKELER